MPDFDGTDSRKSGRVIGWSSNLASCGMSSGTTIHPMQNQMVGKNTILTNYKE